MTEISEWGGVVFGVTGICDSTFVCFSTDSDKQMKTYLLSGAKP